MVGLVECVGPVGWGYGVTILLHSSQYFREPNLFEAIRYISCRSSSISSYSSLLSSQVTGHSFLSGVVNFLSHQQQTLHTLTLNPFCPDQSSCTSGWSFFSAFSVKVFFLIKQTRKSKAAHKLTPIFLALWLKGIGIGHSLCCHKTL